MNREEVQLLGFEIVAYAGDARSKLLEALKQAEAGDFAKAEALVEEAGGCIAEAHKAQTRSIWSRNSLQHHHDAWTGPLDDNHLVKRCDSSSHRII